MKNNLDYLKKNFNENPFILKSISRMPDINNVSIEYIKDYIKIIQSKPKELKNIHIAYNNYQTFLSLYKATLQITKREMAQTDFSTLKKEDQLKALKLHKIKYEEFNNSIIIKSDDFETTRTVGSKNWCIYKSRNLWKCYNEKRVHLIILKGEKTYGVSISGNYFSAFDENDKPISYNSVKKLLPLKYRKIYNLRAIFLELFKESKGSLLNVISRSIRFYLLLSLNINILELIIGFYHDKLMTLFMIIVMSAPIFSVIAEALKRDDINIVEDTKRKMIDTFIRANIVIFLVGNPELNPNWLVIFLDNTNSFHIVETIMQIGEYLRSEL